ncbi:MAG: hypothetical protein EBS29_14180 [Chloroflexia bacterium]|nr:hypothetical protein [Chloroflexia bacterium]
MCICTQEEQMLINAHQIYGNHWTDIARVIPGRPENHVKNYWNATLRRKDMLRVDGTPCLLKQYIIDSGLDTWSQSTTISQGSEGTGADHPPSVRRSQRIGNKPTTTNNDSNEYHSTTDNVWYVTCAVPSDEAEVNTISSQSA